MRFKTKDLMVSVTPAAEMAEADLARVCALHTHICFSPTWCHHHSCLSPTWQPCGFHTDLCGPCTFHWSACVPCSLLGPTWECPGITAPCRAGSRPVFDPTIYVRDREDLATVRTQLRETLAKLDEVEKAGLAGDIQTLAEAERFEAGLKEALQQVQAAKKNLKK